jgi:actin-like protein 6B
MYQNILVVGGNTMTPGFTETLEKNLYSNAPESTKVKLQSHIRGFERRFSPWLGGSILASTGTFQNMWISKFEYEESGKSIVKRKCLH